MVDITTIEPNALPEPLVVLIDGNRILSTKNRQLKYFVAALLIIVIAVATTTFIHSNNPRKENDN
jgi:hypothetical protein